MSCMIFVVACTTNVQHSARKLILGQDELLASDVRSPGEEYMESFDKGIKRMVSP